MNEKLRSHEKCQKKGSKLLSLIENRDNTLLITQATFDIKSIPKLQSQYYRWGSHYNRQDTVVQKATIPSVDILLLA